MAAIGCTERLTAIENGEAVTDSKGMSNVVGNEHDPYPFFRTRSMVDSTLAV